MKRSQFELFLSKVYRRDARYATCIAKLKSGKDGKARISPREAAEEIFRGEEPEQQLLCFLLLVSRGNELALDVINDLGKPGDGRISVDEALQIMEDELDKQCRLARAETIKLIESLPKNKVIPIKPIKETT